VLAANEREALLRVADQLSIELGYDEREEVPAMSSPLSGGRGLMPDILDSEDELLASRLRQGLAKVAVAIGGNSGAIPGNAVGAALDGVEMVIRGELVRGNAGQLPALLPSFVFLVTLSVADQDRALRLSQRAAQLIEGAAPTAGDG
jgi:hypothetical protein